MKNIIKLYVLIMLIFTGFVSCSDDDSDFVGKDHNIVSFSLENEGNTYIASISGNKIEIDIPKYTNLNKAKVQYKLSENAKIIPDPSTILDWNEDQVFRVESYDGKYSSYEFIINRTNIINNNDIIVKTQEDVDNILKSGITEIDGNLIIGEYYFPSSKFDTIKNLDALYKINKVKKNIIINNTFCGNNINGLANITKLGSFSIGTEGALSTITKKIDINFPNLISANKIVVCTNKLINFYAPKLTSVNNLFLNSDNLLRLNLNALTSVVNNFTITCEDKNGNIHIDNVSIPNLKTVEGNLNINNLANLNKINLNALNQVSGDLKLNNLIIKRIKLKELKHIGGSFEFLYNKIASELELPKLEDAGTLHISTKDMYNYKLTKLDLSKLNLVKGDLTIEYFNDTSLTLDQLVSVGGTLTLKSFIFAKSINLPKFEECNKLVISSNANLTSLNINLLKKCEDIEIKSLRAIESLDLSKIEIINSIELLGLAAINSINLPKVIEGNIEYSGKNSIEFIGLETVKGDFTASVSSSDTIFTLKGIKSLGSIEVSGRELITINLENIEKIDNIEFNLNKLTTFSAPKLQEVANLELNRTYAFNTLNCPLLTEISEKLTLTAGNSWSKTKMTQENLNMFSNLNKIGSLEITFCGKLKDFSGLTYAINSLSEDNWKVNGNLYNPTYQDMKDKKYKGTVDEKNTNK